MIRDIEKRVELRIRVHFETGEDRVTRHGAPRHDLGHGRLQLLPVTFIAEP
jgi:hypothetical protein